MKLLILIFSLLSFCFSCGVKGPPLHPLSTMPTTQQKDSKVQKITESENKTKKKSGTNQTP